MNTKKRPTAKMNKLGLIKLPADMCQELKLQKGSSVFITAEKDIAVLRKTRIHESAIERKVSETNRIVLPLEIRRKLNFETNDTIYLDLALSIDGVFLAKE